MCDWPIQHRLPSPVFRRLARKTCARGRKGTGGRPINICDHMGQCGIPPFPCSHSLVDAHPRMMSLLVAPYSPFLNPIEEFFSAWRWKVFDHRPQDQMSLLDAMDATCQDITAEHCQGWIRHTKRFFQDALPEKISDVMWMRTCGQTQKTGPIRLHLLLLYYVLQFIGGFFCFNIHIIQ